MPVITGIDMLNRCSISMRSKLPIPQKVNSRSCSLFPKYCINSVAAENTNPKTKPVNNNLCVCSKPRLIRSCKPSAENAPIVLPQSGDISKEKEKALEKNIKRAIPNVAPGEIPIKYGPAREFLNSVCIRRPEKLKPIPVIAAPTTLGNRNSQNRKFEIAVSQN